MDPVIVLLSGGLDSIVLATIAREARRLAAAVFVAYGQPAESQERDAAGRWAGQNRELLVELRCQMPGGDALAIGAGEPGPRVVPCRNLVLLSLAAGVAAGRGAREIWYGATAEDQAAYTDCRPEFAQALGRVLALDGAPVSVRAPLSGMRRSDVRTLARALAVIEDQAWSCYQPTAAGEPCGTCNSCRQG